ncbi:hypothetical protein AGLY_007299 [Aphis glycines]|uniref:Transmembrane protein n=1 Tax=Aphis glycines TaxID=307491 RepID=A0A6G0TRH0_APHGL|nr:hypothetical protein AGLY_007299 [Aphis glycines]
MHMLTNLLLSCIIMPAKLLLINNNNNKLICHELSIQNQQYLFHNNAINTVLISIILVERIREFFYIFRFTLKKKNNFLIITFFILFLFFNNINYIVLELRIILGMDQCLSPSQSQMPMCLSYMNVLTINQLSSMVHFKTFCIFINLYRLVIFLEIFFYNQFKFYLMHIIIKKNLTTIKVDLLTQVNSEVLVKCIIEQSKNPYINTAKLVSLKCEHFNYDRLKLKKSGNTTDILNRSKIQPYLKTKKKLIYPLRTPLRIGVVDQHFVIRKCHKHTSHKWQIDNR